MITASQILAHLLGDYILQSDWMAQNKTKRSWPCLVHAMIYTLCFVPIFLAHHSSDAAILVILVTHFLIDRFRLARFVVSAKNTIGQPYAKFLASPNEYSTATGYPKGVPDWMAVWLLIIADNVCHITINGLALRYL